jgi:putative ABC transport system ATP-binding protein
LSQHATAWLEQDGAPGQFAESPPCISSRKISCHTDMSPPAQTPPALAFRDVSLSRSGRQILDRFNLQLAPGEQALLLGPSGSGKTSLLHLAAGLLTPDSGAISLAGQEMPARPADRDSLRRQTVGIVFQTLRLISALTLRGNLALAARLSGQPDTQIDQLLEQLGLGHRADARPRALSQGEAQRAAIARALVARPALLLADEPTSALDDASADRVATLLTGLSAAQGTALLVATHDSRLKPHFSRTIDLAGQPASRQAGFSNSGGRP